MEARGVVGPLSEEWIGVTFTNPVTGERIEVLEIGDDEKGDFVCGRLTVRPGGSGPPRHVHPHIEETFSVESGKLSVWLDGDRNELTRGESVRIPPKTPHTFENRSDRPVVFEGVSRPGSRLIYVLATLFGLARDGKIGDDGAPGFLQAMVFAREMQDVMYMASPPYPVQRALWTLFAPLGQLAGYQAMYERYLNPDFWTA